MLAAPQHPAGVPEQPAEEHDSLGGAIAIGERAPSDAELPALNPG